MVKYDEHALVECSQAKCDNWTRMTLPDNFDLTTSKFMCGFCSHSQLKVFYDEMVKWKTLADEREQKIDDMNITIDEMKDAYKTKTTPPTETALLPTPTPTYADALKTKSIAHLTRLMTKEKSIQDDRKDNLVVKGTEPTKNDVTLVKEIALEIGVDTDGIKMRTKRVGPVKDGKQKMIVTMDQDKRRELMKAAKTLKDSKKFDQIYIEPDMTNAEREEQYQLRQELRQRRKDNPDKVFYIRRGQVTERT